MNNPGYSGSIVVTGTALLTFTDKPIRRIDPITSCTFTTLTDTSATTNGTAVQSVGADYGTVTAETSLFGTFTAVQLATGSAILYY